jgi:radical SAM-linked protein
VVVLSWIASTFSRLAGGEPVPRSLASVEDIRTMISVGHSEGEVEAAEAKMLHKVFDFGDRPVREVMVPRPEVVCIEEGSKVEDFLSLYAQSPLSRFPVFQENMDNVTGILAIKDVLMGLAKNTVDRESLIDDLVRPAYFTPETKRIGELFAEMRDRNYQMCVVVDEYGGTSGIVSLSRLVEEVVGPVGDELAGVEKDYEAINAYTFEIDAGMRIDEANEEMALDLPEDDDYETVAGLILHLLGRIPRRGMQRLRIRFARRDAVKYISHLDIIRLCERALRRAGIALAYSEGFSPHPRISLAAPLSVGITSEVELMDIVVEGSLTPHWLIASVNRQLPEGVEFSEAYPIAPGVPSLQAQVRFAEYEVDVDTDRDAEDIEAAVSGLLATSELPWHHDRDTGRRHYDLRALIDDVWVVGEATGRVTIGMRLRCDSSGSGRPEQVAVALGFTEYPRAIRRTRLILSSRTRPDARRRAPARR